MKSAHPLNLAYATTFDVYCLLLSFNFHRNLPASRNIPSKFKAPQAKTFLTNSVNQIQIYEFPNTFLEEDG